MQLDKSIDLGGPLIDDAWNIYVHNINAARVSFSIVKRSIPLSYVWF